jgi:hypothetical protein
MSETTETLVFKIGLSGTFHDRRPAYSVSVDGRAYADSEVSVATDEVFYVEFGVDVAEDADHLLSIRLNNKQDTDVIENEDKTAIVKDMLLNIKSIEVDDIDLGGLLWTHSRYQLDQPHRFNEEIVTELKNCVNLGFNGAWELRFTAPFYVWLLENL